MEHFRFEDLDIWKDAIDISDKLFDYSDKAEEKRCFRFAEQLRAAALSISNNIAEGSGSFSDKEFASFPALRSLLLALCHQHFANGPSLSALCPLPSALGPQPPAPALTFP